MTTLGSRIQINKERNIAAPDKVWGNPWAMLQSFQAETPIASFCHPRTVRTIAASSLDPPLSERMIKVEFAGSRTLLNILDNEKEVIDEERRRKFASHITMALEFIHGQSIAHLDVKPANILVDSKDVCKLGDFGCSQILDKGDENLRPRVLSVDETSCDYQQLVESLWQANPCLRPTASDSIGILRSLRRN